MTNTNRCSVDSEVGRLKRVVLHRPTLALERLTPSNCHDLLFDDVLDVEEACKEHDVFSKTLRDHGVEVLFVEDLLADVLSIPEGMAWIWDNGHDAYSRFGSALAEGVKLFLAEQSPKSAADYLIGGITWEDMSKICEKKKCNSLVRATRANCEFALPPIPNILFTRDTSCWIYNGVSVNPMAKEARKRETLYVKAIYNFHPIFKNSEFKFWYGNDDAFLHYASIEGGDVLVIGDGIVLIGLGERTTPQAVELIAESMFKDGVAKAIVAVELPKARSSMHLDTVMTMLDRDCFTVYKPVIDEVRCWELTSSKEHRFNMRELPGSIFSYLEKKLGVDKIRIIPTGGNEYQAEREQWNDANNVLTIEPGVVVGYSHNKRTIALMEDAGIKVLGIPGNQLGKGRGGARCMSCPIEREGL